MSKKQKRVFWPGLALIFSGLMVITLVSARSKTAASPPSQAETAVVAQGQPTPAVPVVKPRIGIWIHGNDVRPKIIHAWPGTDLFTVDNETQVAATLQIDRVLPSGILQPTATIMVPPPPKPQQTALLSPQIAVPAQLKRVQQDVQLAIGEYVFYEVSRPSILGRLIVAPR